jgi:Uncharacterized FAD-dependent dehydrogenases
MIRLQQLKMRVEQSEDDIKKEVAKILSISLNEINAFSIAKKSIDARKKEDIKYVYTVDVSLEKEEDILKRKRNNQNIQVIEPKTYKTPLQGEVPLKKRPVIVGSGPAGLYCGLLLAECGYRPIILERGEAVETRQETVHTFWKTGKLSPNSNVQFGEGGAGTFSDGKLNTLVKDSLGRNKKVLEEFVKAGAAEEILYLNKPHIGTDVLIEVVKNLRKKLLSLGGEIRFESQLTDIIIENNEITGITINNQEKILTEVLVLAIGHSARDTFEMLERLKVQMEAKSFAVGVRVEHSQQMINTSQYGEKFADKLPAADYKLTAQLSNGRGIYSFCMCPGGYVVNAASEEGGLAVNGMSYYKRDSENANSAIIVTVTPEDFGETGCLAGVKFQRELEKKAFVLGGGKIPVQLYGDFLAGKCSTAFGDIKPCAKGNLQFANLKEILPDFISSSLEEGIKAFDKKIKGFARRDMILSGIESRTSSPVRIVRDNLFESNIKGLYPCGEGAGYAGGITSAAIDGIKVSEAIIQKYMPLF